MEELFQTRRDLWIMGSGGPVELSDVSKLLTLQLVIIILKVCARGSGDSSSSYSSSGVYP